MLNEYLSFLFFHIQGVTQLTDRVLVLYDLLSQIILQKFIQSLRFL